MSRPKHLAGGRPASSDDFILQRRQRLVRRCVSTHGTVLLDYGCGNGAQTRSFEADFDCVIGADVDRAHLEQFRESMESDRAVPLLYDGLRLPVRDASVDLVISFEVLEHVRDERAALAEIARVLRPGGRLAMTVPNRWWVFETHGADLPWLPWNRVPFFSWLPKRWHDRWARARIYRRREIIQLLRTHGFEIDTSGYVTAPMDVLRSRWLQNGLRKTLFAPDTTPIPFPATAVFVSARRPSAGTESERPTTSAASERPTP